MPDTKEGVVIRDYLLGEIRLRYLTDEATGQVSMLMLPLHKESCFSERRDFLYYHGDRGKAWDIGSLCHLSLRHHAQGNGAGSTLKYGESTQLLKYQKQEVTENAAATQITTYLLADEGYQIIHTVNWHHGEPGIEVETSFRNLSSCTITLDMLSSFTLDNLSPFQKDDAPYCLKLHRFRGGWCHEGKHCEDTVENLNLEGTWARAFPESERYGVLGSFPVKRWFPFGCVEDIPNQVYWAAQLASNSSWQMEFSRDGDCYSLSGGIADREFGSWWRHINPGERFTAPKAYLSVSNLSLSDVCQNITQMFHKYADQQPACEQELPILFNEWCTTWGNPSHQAMSAIAQALKDLPISYLVIDAAWSKQPLLAPEPQAGNGDWEPDDSKFPQGILPLSRELQQTGRTLGIWMEFEVTTNGAHVHSGIYDDMHLTSGDSIIQTGYMRRFWDFRREETICYLRDKVIRFLKENEIRYLKVDYNGSIGAGCDGADSPGEGLRCQMEGVLCFFQQMRQEMPDLVIENCASGGHRLEPSMMTTTAMSCFSDTHECREIPYIAASLHHLVLPRQNQIWAVISPHLSIHELEYRLTSVLLGRFCLSGDILGLNKTQRDKLREICCFYEEVKPIIKYGRSELIRNTTNNLQHLRGAQAVMRQYQEHQILLVCHTFAGIDEPLTIRLPKGDWQIRMTFGTPLITGMELSSKADSPLIENPIPVEHLELTLDSQQEWCGFALLLEKIDHPLPNQAIGNVR